MRNNRATPSRSWTDRAATAAGVQAVLGEIDPITMERLLATGATTEEIGEAVMAIEDSLSFGDLQRGPGSDREAEVRAILEEVVFENFEDREADREVMRV